MTAGDGSTPGFEFLGSAPVSPLCGYCRQPIGEPPPIACPRCRALYHADCWAANGQRCGIYGCEPVTIPTAPAARPIVPPSPPRPRWRPGPVVIAIGLISAIRLGLSLVPMPTPHARPQPLTVPRLPIGLEPPRPFFSEFAPNTAEFYVRRAIYRDSAGDRDGAFADNTKAIEINPNLPTPWCNRGTLKIVKKDFQGALEDFETASRLSPQCSGAFGSPEDAKDPPLHLDDAVLACTEALDLPLPERAKAEAWSSLGMVHWIHHQPEGALADFTRAITLDLHCAVAWHFRGHVRSDLGDFAGAAADFTQALEFDPGTEWLRFDRGCARYNLQAWKDCLPDFEAAAADRSPLRDDARMRIFFARARLGEGQEAMRQLKGYLDSRDPQMGSVWSLERLRLVAGMLPEEEFLPKLPYIGTRPQAERACEAYFCIGTLRLLHQDAPGATEYFRKCVDTGKTSFMELQSAKAELSVMEKSR